MDSGRSPQGVNQRQVLLFIYRRPSELSGKLGELAEGPKNYPVGFCAAEVWIRAAVSV